MFPTVPPPSQRLLVFARLPELGKVKTRLAAEVGAERALAVYESMLHELIAGIGTSTPDLEIEVMWPPTPNATGEALRRAFGSHALAIQTGENLGDRLSMALSERFFFHRTEKIVVIGVDDPSLTRELIDRAFSLLDSCEYVLGPATDGGYYLIGCRALAYDPSVFQGIEWSTSTVLSTTLARIAELGRTVALLPEHYDIDTAADLERHMNRVGGRQSAVGSGTATQPTDSDSSGGGSTADRRLPTADCRLGSADRRLVLSAMKILNAAQMRSIDQRATERFGVPSIVLMENAAIAVVDALFEHYPDCSRVAIFCGTGANGGDGFAVARHLENRGVVPVVVIVGERSSIHGDALTNLTVCERLGVPIYDIRASDDIETMLAHAADADVIVDAIFGTGLNRAPSGIHAEVIRDLAELRLPVLAVDLPSGADASSQTPFDPCVQAELTVTFAAPKICHVFEPAALCCGEVIVADITIPEAAVEDEMVSLALITPKDVQPHVAPRLSSTHKGTYGHVGIIAGSPGRSGAAVLSARGAIRTGAGLVSVMTDADTAKLVHAGSLESMTYSGGDLQEFLANKTAVLIGPGLADGEEAWIRTRELVQTIELPLVIDASALNAFASRASELHPRALPRALSRVLTPHPGELARLLDSNAAEINADRIGAAREAARLTGCVVVLKGFQSLIAEPNGHVYVNPTGNPGMGSGGMGDVLGGMIAALLARGTDPLDAACAAVYLHGLAGDILKEQMGDTGLTAMDLADRIPAAIQRNRL